MCLPGSGLLSKAKTGSWRDIIYRCELYPVSQMGRPFYHLYIHGRKRANLYFEKRWVVASKRGFSNDIGEQLGEAVEEYNKLNG